MGPRWAAHQRRRCSGAHHAGAPQRLADGFRHGEAEVAAFRLCDVARSYAASKGQARNVGVIGFAVFEERRPVAVEPPPWRDRRFEGDTRQRRDADAFPGWYANPARMVRVERCGRRPHAESRGYFLRSTRSLARPTFALKRSGLESLNQAP